MADRVIEAEFVVAGWVRLFESMNIVRLFIINIDDSTVKRELKVDVQISMTAVNYLKRSKERLHSNVYLKLNTFFILDIQCR